ncbi:MAG: DNA-3-methyladenine glycosylase I [Proteobacteria bacterium]|nr:MAG: DNA-3-methyladenine glycosylase I [Pseudomonadota bacterium]
MRVKESKTDKPRCWWCESDPLYVVYHDKEWGVPVHDDRKIFEMLILEGFQAGLSWLTVLKKRENFRKAFSNFNPEKIARYGRKDIARLMRDAGIIRNRQKIEAAVANARSFLETCEEYGSFDSYIWKFTNYKTLRDPKGMTKQRIPATSPESDAMSRDLKKRGFKFVGSTICYAHMQATGMVDDHVKGCFRYKAR